jgi:hypothetical protein
MVNILLTVTAVAPCFSAINISNDSINSNILNFSLFDLKVVSISFTKSSQIDILMNQHLDIIDIKDSEITAYVNLVQLKSLCDLGFNPNILFENIQEMNGYIYGSEFLQFHTYTQMTQELQEIANTYADIAQLYDLGHSVQGRVIWGLKITDNPTVEENEAEVRICGCHHGNEYMSVELPLLIAWHLVQNYDTDPDIEDLVDNREIWIIPLVNPDGREMGTRYNANGVDLNRDYGYLWGGEGGSPGPFSQPETQIIRQHALENNFVLSLSYHTTEAIVNYIWNYKGQPVVDHDVVVQLSQQYGSHNGYWVVEGYDWYQTRGDTNDFSYGCRGDIDWTIETQNSNIPQAWDLNRVAMLEIIDAADMGLTGVVRDSDTGEPIAATVWVEEAYWPCFTDPEVGDYHRVLLPGAYNVHFRANSYEEKVINVEVLDTDEPTTLDVYLNPSNDFYAYQVTLCYFNDPYNYPNNFQNNPTEGVSALGPPDGTCASLGVGGYMVLDMGEEGIIVDHENATDFKIFEGDATQDGYTVYVSSNWSGPWINLGLVTGTAEFDLANYSVESAQFIKIVDDNNGNPTEQNPGVDIDAVQHLIPIVVNNPPNRPYINGTKEGKVGIEYEYTFVSTDPEEDDLYYYVDWGDNNTEQWLGPFASGQELKLNHSWVETGEYIIRARAKDTFDEESSWGIFTVTMPRNKIVTSSILYQFLERYPFLIKLLSLIKL